MKLTVNAINNAGNKQQQVYIQWTDDDGTEHRAQLYVSFQKSITGSGKMVPTLDLEVSKGVTMNVDDDGFLDFAAAAALDAELAAELANKERRGHR